MLKYLRGELMKKTKRFLIILSVILAVFAVLNIIPPKKVIEDNPFIVEKGELPMLVAHRGGKYNNPEKTLLEMTKEKQESDKRQLRVEIFVGLISTIFLFSMIYIASLFEMKTWIRCLLIGFGFIVFFVGCIVALILEQKAGYYECKECKHKYVPTFKVILNSPHMGRTRYMKCPNCNKKSWHKKVINK